MSVSGEKFLVKRSSLASREKRTLNSGFDDDDVFGHSGAKYC